MEPVVAQSIATLISALATAVLMAATYYFGTARRERKRAENEEAEDDAV